MDLEFNIRSGSYASKWATCMASVRGLPPYRHSYPRFLETDPGIYQERIQLAVSQDADIQEFLSNADMHISDINQDVVNAIHRYIEHHKHQAAHHLTLHNDIHYLESIWDGAREVVFKKLQWVPPGTMIDMDLADYAEFTTEPCVNFIQDDFSHVGRSPHNSYLMQDDTSLYTSCVIQHKVGTGVKWFLPDDSHIFDDRQGFQAWVSEHQEFFSKQWGINTTDDPRLCHGRIIIAEGAEDYRNLDRTWDYVTEAFVTT